MQLLTRLSQFSQNPLYKDNMISDCYQTFLTWIHTLKEIVFSLSCTSPLSAEAHFNIKAYYHYKKLHFTDKFSSPLFICIMWIHTPRDVLSLYWNRLQEFCLIYIDYQYGNSHWKDMTFLWVSYLYNVNPYTQRYCVYIEMGSLVSSQYKDHLSQVWVFLC